MRPAEPTSSAILIDGFTPCACTHTYRRHEDIGVCEAAGCGCTEFRVGVAGQPVRPSAPQPAAAPSPKLLTPPPVHTGLSHAEPAPAPRQPPAAAQARPSLLERAAASKRPATRKLGQRLARLRKELQDKLDEEDALARAAAERAERDAEVRAEIDRLQAELTRARGRLSSEVYPEVKRQKRPRGAEPPAPCPHCPKVSKTAGGLSAHLKAHHPEEWAERVRRMHQPAGAAGS